MTTYLSAGECVTVTSALVFFLGGTVPWLLRRRPITLILDKHATHARSSVVDLPVWADQGCLPGLGGNEMCLTEQANGPGKEMVEKLDGDSDCTLFVNGYRYALCGGI